MLLANWKKEIDIFSRSCDWVGIREFSETIDTIPARNGQAEVAGSTVDHGLMVEVLKNGQFSCAGTVDMTHQGLQNAFNQALTIAEASAGKNIYHFDESVRPVNAGNYATKVVEELDSLSFGEIQSRLIKITESLKVSEEVVDAWAYVMLIKTEVSFISSNGSEWQQEFSISCKDFGVNAQRGNESQSRSYGMNGMQKGLEDLDLNVLLGEAVRVGKQAIELLGAPDCPADVMDLILTPDQLYLQIHESVGHPLEVDRILGDERNYAGWSFISPEDFGTLQYGSELMNITFDPTVEGEMASYAFDDNGVKAEREFLIQKGKLLRGLGGIESQKRSGVPGVSCARSASWNRPAMDRMANLNLEPGSSTLEDMIAATKKGILMECNRSWSIDDYRNKFQFGCEFGTLIEDGKLTKIVKNPNYRGITTSFWNNLKMVGNEDTMQIFGSPYCGKGEPNQSIRVGHRTPAALFKDIEVFGGA